MATVTSDAKFSKQATLSNDIERSEVMVLRFLGSLKITVVLFALSLVLVLVGTLAQDEMNMQQVKERYFLDWIAALHVDDFFPQAFFPHERPIEIVLPFPGGALIGVLLMVNLIAAKVTRFKIHAKGSQLIAGCVFLAIGAALTAAIVFGGHSTEGLQGAPPISYPTLWRCVQVALGAGAVGMVFVAMGQKNHVVKSLAYSLAAVLGIVLMYTIFSGTRIGDPGLRIVWQLAKGLGAGLVLMVGCLLVFDRQGGNVLLHLGVALLMVGQFAFGDRQLEQRMNLVEGESTNSLVNMDRLEMTIISRKEGVDEVTAIPGSRLRSAAESKTTITDPKLPVSIKVLSFFENSKLQETESGGSNPADTGIGTRYKAVELRKHGGTDSNINIASAYVELMDKSEGKSLGTFLISQLISDRELLFPGEPVENQFDDVTVGESEYMIGLKFHREVKPYWVQLEDVRRIDYSGTDTPRDYRSYVRIFDTETGKDMREQIWMNNPLRYRGETFFQSSYTALPSGKELTGLQVVRNSGWLIPYVACSITALGMLVHFLGTLSRFIARRERETRQRKKKTEGVALPRPRPMPSNLGPVLAIAAMGVFAVVSLVPWSAVYNAWRPSERDQKYDFYAAGMLPTQFGGRVMPLDAYARQTLKAISNRESLYLVIPEQYGEEENESANAVEAKNVNFSQEESETGDDESEGNSDELENDDNESEGGKPTDDGDDESSDDRSADDSDEAEEDEEEDPLAKIKDRVGGKAKKISALQWLMELAIDEQGTRHLPMFRIDSQEIRSELGLERRKSKLYSLMELLENWGRVSELISVAREKVRNMEDLSFKEKKLLELDNRTRQFTITAKAFQEQEFPVIPASLFPSGTTEEQMEGFRTRIRRELQAEMDDLAQSSAPSIIPPPQSIASDGGIDPKWKPFASAFFENDKAKVLSTGGEKAKPLVDHFTELLTAYEKEDHAGFNAAVDKHLEEVQAYPVVGYTPKRVSLERWMNSNWPTGVATVFYILCVVLGLIYFATGMDQVRLTTIGILLIALVIHSIAIVGRIYITGRAPVINIYSSAVFIGWAAVLFGLGSEFIFQRGFGSILASTSGMLTLLVAYGLNTGDTMPVLQAVLDTQFWLATHVISVSLGYVATLVAGMLGIGYLIVDSRAIKVLVSILVRILPALPLTAWLSGRFLEKADQHKADETSRRNLYRMCYGASCFGILFSFVGTVLGGLWADDSWGRFWGWDPKENGALLIVIWNALMLHARWDGMVKGRGFAVLAIGGNIVTAWSWFGTNELGIGLHSYGFTEGVLMWLMIFVASQLFFILFGMSYRRSENQLT